MKALTVRDLAERVGGELRGDPEALVEGFATDNREVKPGHLFLAIRGARVDGHDYASQAIEAGAPAVLAERSLDVPHVLVANLVEALKRLAASYRDTFEGPVIAITGSAGKTTTKEFAAAALSPLGKVLKTQGNRNSEYTAPLLWPELDEDVRAVVVEMAMRGFGQIEHLASFTRPTIGLITNIGYSHLEQVGTREGIAQAKGELIRSMPEWGTVILWEGDPFYKTLHEMAAGPVKTFGFNELSDCWLSSYTPIDWSRSRIEGYVEGQPFAAELPTVGRHLALNAAAGLLAATVAGADPDAASKALASAEMPPMRMQVEERDGVKVLLDTYNASPPSMIAAIETFATLPAERRFAVIGEMRELGAYTQEAHREVGRALASAALDGVIFYGEPTRFSEAERPGERAESLEDVRLFLSRLQPGDAVLIKGSRALELERALA